MKWVFYDALLKQNYRWLKSRVWNTIQNPGFSRKITVSHRFSWNKSFQREGNHKVDILLPRIPLYTKFSWLTYEQLCLNCRINHTKKIIYEFHIKFVVPNLRYTAHGLYMLQPDWTNTNATVGSKIVTYCVCSAWRRGYMTIGICLPVNEYGMVKRNSTYSRKHSATM